jgi:hypothetical protein
VVFLGNWYVNIMNFNAPKSETIRWVMIPSLSNIQRSNIQVSMNSSGDQITLYYVVQDEQGKKASKTVLHLKTGCWTCPFGRDDQNKLMVTISDEQYFKIVELDNYGRDICKYFMKAAGKEIPDDPSELPYKSMIQTVDGMEVLQLQLSERTRYFDNNGIKLDTEQALQWISGQFSARFLLSLSLRVWNDGGNTKYYWSVQPVQIKIRRFCTLPEGCKIFESEAEFREASTEGPAEKEKEEEGIVDFDPDVNELLD